MTPAARARILAMFAAARRARGPARRRAPVAAYPTALEAEFAFRLTDASRLALSGLRAHLAALGPEIASALATDQREVRGDAASWRMDSRTRSVLAEVRRNLDRLIDLRPVEGLAARYAGRISDYNRASLRRQLRDGLGADPFFADRGLASLTDDFIASSVELITGMGRRSMDDVERAVDGAVASGRRWEELAPEIEGALDVEPARARLIARDQVGKFYGQVNASRQQQLGVTRFIWRTVEDERVRDEHRELNGRVWEYASPPDDGKFGPVLPGQAINCIPGDAMVSFPSGATKAYRRRYSGELTEFVTATGVSVRSTPNHPWLTQRGWLPAHLVQVGDYLVETPAQRLDLSVGDPERRDTTAEEEFGALAVRGQQRLRDGRAEWFHGDGVIHEQVDVVEVDRGLLDEGVPAGRESRGDDGLAVASPSTPGHGAAPPGLIGAPHPADGVMGGGGPSGALLRCRLGHADGHRRAAPTPNDASLAEQPGNGGPAHAEVPGDRQLADPAFVHRLGLVAVEIKAVVCHAEWSGYVYNFETATGWYSVHGLISHNCRCSAAPWLDDLIGDGEPVPTGELVE